jgi:hypothetical protein
MNPFDLSASDLLVWGIVAHLIADWPLQNDWMANGKAWPWRWSVVGLAPAFVHATIHAFFLAFLFGYWPGVVLGVLHLLIDTRIPVEWWSRLVRQTQPAQQYAKGWAPGDARSAPSVGVTIPRTVVDVGLEVRFWTDQVFHIACIAVAALLVA